MALSWGNNGIEEGASVTDMLSIQERAEILQIEINRYLQRGFNVLSQTQTTAQLIKPKKFSCLLATLGLLLFGVGFLIYIFYYASQKDTQLYIQVLDDGTILHNGQPPPLPRKSFLVTPEKPGPVLTAFLVLLFLAMLTWSCWGPSLTELLSGR